MKPIYLTIAVAAVFMLLTLSSCDNRTGGPISSGYTISIAPADSQIAGDDLTPIDCYVLDGFGGQVGGVILKFQALDFGYISPEKQSSADEPDGLIGSLNFDPKGNLGNCRIRVWSDEANITDEDTAVVEVLPYNLDFSTAEDTVTAGDFTQLYCRVNHPVTGEQTGMVKIQFTALDFGDVPPNWIMSDDASFSGLQSTVFFDTEIGQSGTARITARAEYFVDSLIRILGSDTTEVVVE